MYRKLLTAVFVVIVGISSGFGVRDSAEAHSSSGMFAVLAGKSGTITTLECYDVHPTNKHHHFAADADPWDNPCILVDQDGDLLAGPHAKAFDNSVDILGSGAVYLQIDYMPTTIRGGWVAAWTYNNSVCSQYAPGTSSYNGQKVAVRIFYYTNSSGGTWQDYNTVLYQHVDPVGSVGSSESSPGWTPWSAYLASNPFLPANYPNIKYLDNETGAGIQVANVTSIGGSVPAVCSTATHLHQEGYGSYNYFRRMGQGVTGRFSDVVYFALSGLTSTKP